MMERLHRRLEMALYDNRRINRTLACFCQSMQEVCRILNADEGKKNPPKKPGKNHGSCRGKRSCP
jgi:hypothetical protein